MSINEGNRCFYGGSGSAAFDIEFRFGVRFYLYRLNRTITRFIPLRKKRVILMRFILLSARKIYFYTNSLDIIP